ncbi:MAG TPA: M3 family oligoendopeptidase [Chloroflexota bacterium]|jgi:oligoendopeptidase F
MTETAIKRPAEGVRWDLSDLFAGPSDPAWGEELAALLAAAAAFADQYRGTINPGRAPRPEGTRVAGGPAPEHFLEALRAYESIYDRASRAGAFARLLYAADSADAGIRELVNRADAFSTELRNRLLFFDLEWLDVPEADARRVMADSTLAGYANYLERERLFLPHKLSEPEEKIVNEKDLTGRRAWTKLFQEATSGLAFPLREDDGSIREATLSETLARMYNPRREVRQQAHDVLYEVLGQNSQFLTFTYDTLVQDHLTMDRLRKHPDPMHGRHLTNNVPAEAVEQMMAVVEENYGIAHDYWRAKADMLGLDRLTIYDQYAPIGAGAEQMSWDESRRIVLDALGRFDGRFGALAAEFFDRAWIDAEVRPGKRGGAFCAYPSPTVHPWVLCNFTGNRRDVMTVAHELGHGLHGQLARKQSLLNFHSPLPLAETASVFAEMLVFDHLLEGEPDAAVRRALTAGQVENVFATVYRQNVLTRFEQTVYRTRTEQRLTTDKIADLWIEANAPYYGEALRMTDGYRLGWSYISHFINSPFYCYAYTFGELLVLALYGLYREQGRAFVPEYVRLLERGGSLPPADAVAALGVDIRDPNFWRRGFAEIRRLVDAVVTG